MLFRISCLNNFWFVLIFDASKRVRWFEDATRNGIAMHRRMMVVSTGSM